MKRNLLLIGVFLLCNQCFSWDLSGIAGSRSNAMGNFSVALHDFWSIQNNPAGMAEFRTISLGFSYDNRFFMKELSFYNGAFLLPVKFGTFGLSFSRFGFENYNENKFGLAFARSFGPYLKMGLKLDYLLFNFNDDYEKQKSATFELGLQSNITDDLCVGVYIFNPHAAKLKTQHHIRLPVVFRFGLSYKVTNDFLACAEAEYNSDKNLDYRFGLEYNALKEFYIRIGVHTSPATATFGVGYTLSRVTIDVSASMNQFTGVTFQSSLIFKLKEPKP